MPHRKPRRDDAVVGLVDQVVRLAEDSRETLRRVAKLGRKLNEANRWRQRLLNASDALLRKAHAEELLRLGAEELDVERLELDTPFDGVLMAIATRHLPGSNSLIQLVADETVPAPLFAAEVLGAR